MKKNRSITAKRVLLALAALLILLAGSFLSQQKSEGQTPAAVQLGLQTARAETDFKLLKTGTGGQYVRQMQSVLKDLGYYTGNIDGNFSRAFEAAVKAFQKDFGLEETGTIDFELYSLLIGEFSGLPEATAAPSAKTPAPKAASAPKPTGTAEPFVEKNGEYSDKEHVAAYLRAFGSLPSNYITKQQAQQLGWSASRGNLWKVAPGKSIGGDRYGNYEGLLPQQKGRKYFECDIDFDGGFRNAKRIIYSNDGLIFYTEDHYQTFEEITE